MKRNSRKPPPRKIETDFPKAVRNRFFDAHNASTWPTSASKAGRTGQATSQMPVALRAMIAAVVRKKLPKGAGAPSTALGRVKAAAAATNWPRGSSVPAKFTKNAAQYRDFEVTVATKYMMEAFSRAGGGGGPKGWPVNPGKVNPGSG